MKIRKRTANEDPTQREIEEIRKALRLPPVKPSQTHRNPRKDKKLRRKERWD